MIKALRVDNFKSLVGFSVEFHKNNVIVGNNASGKSSILQAIDFLCNSIREDFNIILERRGWTVENIKSKLNGSKGNKIQFESEYLLEVENEKKQYVWGLTISVNKSKNEILLHSEKVTVNDEIVLLYSYGKEIFYKHNDENKTKLYLPNVLAMSSSLMKILGNSENVSEELQVLIRFLEKSSSFELLSPSEMRLSSRGNQDTIGMSGKNLPSFIKKMNQEQKISFMKKMQEVLGHRILEVNAETKGKPGWTQINVVEKYKESDVTITSKEMSDGMLRLLAFIAISEIQSSDAVMLLDEVENGINTDYAERLMNVMLRMYDEKKHQLIMTTHSTVFLDYVNAEDIIFLYRDCNGFTKAIHLFQDEFFKEKLDYMWPGEVFLNMSQKDLVEKVLAK